MGEGGEDHGNRFERGPASYLGMYLVFSVLE